jgi:hypothetical protein
MNNTKLHPALEYIVNLIKDAISGIKIEYVSTSAAILKDGNDTIHLEQQFDSSGNTATVLIKDPKDIIYSEDLFPVLNKLKEGGVNADLRTTTVIINDLNVETHLVFQAVKDGFDVISNSYEFVRFVENEVIKVKCLFKFGAHLFGLTVVNEPGLISVKASFDSKFDPAVKTTIENDALRVQKAVNAMFKEGKN